ncbi:hypothetical protein Sjap_026510 [Stephania japonica]|uniref:Uncharacterized protein n=1 Tax=Stephania japonica TaxID=461633 RepID=A0AAP0HGI2_9MAGN
MKMISYYYLMHVQMCSIQVGMTKFRWGFLRGLARCNSPYWSFASRRFLVSFALDHGCTVSVAWVQVSTCYRPHLI